MNCSDLFDRLGFQCRELRDGRLSVRTSFTFSDGETIGFSLHDGGSLITISDNASTLIHASARGIDTSDRKKWRGVRQAIAPFGLELQDSGRIVGTAPKGAEHALFTRYIAAMLVVADLEREVLGIDERVDRYIEEVAFYLATWKPGSPLHRHATAQGHSGRTHRFDFEQDNVLIDAARPHQGTTGSILRKAADVNNNGKGIRMLVVLDDREDAERAAVETDILSTFLSVMPFTRLAGDTVVGQHLRS